MLEPELRSRIRLHVARLSNRQLRQIINDTPAGQQLTESIVTDAPREVRQARTRRQLRGYALWLVVVAVLVFLLVTQLPALREWLADQGLPWLGHATAWHTET